MKLLSLSGICFILLFSPGHAKGQGIDVTISHLRNTKGFLQVSVYRNAEEFDTDSPFLIKKYPKTEIEDGKFSFRLDMGSGIYGIAVLDDENEDGEMEYNCLGIPKEGFGFSGYYHTGLERPDFSDFNFLLGDGIKRIEIVMKYM